MGAGGTFLPAPYSSLEDGAAVAKDPLNKTSMAPTDWRPQLVVVGCSTGGPIAVQKILQPLPSSFRVPIVIAQHMPKGFTRQFAQRLNSTCPLRVLEGADGMVLETGTAYIAPAGFLTKISKEHAQPLSLKVCEVEAKDWLYRPSVDELFLSAAEAIQRSLLAVVMTGMGSDGLKGAQAIKHNGGYVVTESPETAVIYGMPRAVYEAGHSDVQLPVSEISTFLSQFA